MKKGLRELFQSIVNSPIKQSDRQSSSNEENDEGCSKSVGQKSVGHVSEIIASAVRTNVKKQMEDGSKQLHTIKSKKPDSKLHCPRQATPAQKEKHSSKKTDKLKKSERSKKEHKREETHASSSKDEGPSKFVETFGECIKIKTAYGTEHKSRPESQHRHKSEKYNPKGSKQSKTSPKAQKQDRQKQQPEFRQSYVHHEDNSEVRVNKASKSHPKSRPPMQSSQQSPVSPQMPKQVSKHVRSDVIVSSSPATPVMFIGDESSTGSELENTAVRPGKKILLEKKRIRNRKFTYHENLVLIENLVPHFHKLLGNRAAATESAWKNTTWKQIAAAVTSVGVSPRSAEQVRKRYQDIRLALRRKISDENKSRKATGGGPEKKALYHQYEELLRPYIDLDSIVGIKAGFDSSRHRESEQQNSALHIYRQQKLSFMVKLNELLQAHLSSPGELSQNARNVTSSNHTSFVSESFPANDNITFSTLDI